MEFSQRWSSRGRPWLRGHISKSLASKSQVLGLGLEVSSPWPWPRSLKSSKIALFSARGQHYFLYSWNFVGTRQKPCGKFSNNFFVFHNWSIGVAKARGRPPPPPNWNFIKNAYCFFILSFFLAFFAYKSNNNNNIKDQGPRAPLNSIVASQFKRIIRKKWKVFVL